jgi:cell division septal protein FtsQ
MEVKQMSEVKAEKPKKLSKKRLLTTFLVGILAIGLVSAGVVVNWIASTTSVSPEDAISVSGETTETIEAVAGDTVKTTQLTLTSEQENLNIPVEIVVTADPDDEGGIFYECRI